MMSESRNPSDDTKIFTDVAQSHFNSDLTLEMERMSNGVRENGNPDQRLGVDKTGQDLEKSVQYERELEFTKIERQL